MGMPTIGGKSCSVVPERKRGDVYAKAPNPVRYAIEQTYHSPNGAVVMVVHYPDCLNFEGKKILVYRSWKDVCNHMNMTGTLDPHFSATGICPVARFIPTEEGIKMARNLANSL